MGREEGGRYYSFVPSGEGSRGVGVVGGTVALVVRGELAMVELS